jgi:hypothetical protein
MTTKDDQGRALGAGEASAHGQEKLEGFIMNSREPTFMQHILSKEVNLDVTFGFKDAAYAGPPYTPLSSTRSTIRLLLLLPGDFNDDICGFLIEVPIATRPEYMALSYAWGDPTDAVPIQLFGQEFPVTKSLVAALRHIRSCKGIYTVWADAVCINQADTAEKNLQVALMPTIYRSAAEVLVWLGKDAEEDQDSWPGSAERTKMAFDFAKSFARVAFGDLALYVKARSLGEGYPDADDEVRAFLNLLSRKWFSRRWVIQEVLVPDIDRVRAVCGSRGISWKTLVNALVRLQESINLFTSRIGAFFKERLGGILALEATRSLHHIWTSTGGHPARLLSVILSITGGWFAETDRRDRIFALLGLVKDQSSHPALTADYRKSPAEVFINFAKFLFEGLRTTEFLVEAHPQDVDGLPSWVPTWAGIQQIMNGPPNEEVLKGPLSEATADISFPGDGRTLRTKGIIIGCVGSVGVCCPKFRDLSPASLYVVFRTWEGQILDSPLTKKKHGGGKSVIEVWKRTLMHPMGPQGPFLSEELKKHFRALHMVYDMFMDHDQLGPDMISGENEVSIKDVRGLLFDLSSRVEKDCPFVTTDGDIGFTCSGSSVDVRQDDVVCLVPGCSLPLILRSEGARFRLLCRCYVDTYCSLDAQNKALSGQPLVKIDIG